MQVRIMLSKLAVQGALWNPYGEREVGDVGTGCVDGGHFRKARLH